MSDTDTSISRVPLHEPIRFPDETRTAAVTRVESIPASMRGIAFEARGATAKAPLIDIDRLYEAIPGTSSGMIRALELLKQASDNLAAAQGCDSPLDADRFVQRVQLTLPKLFACRSISDGFGVIINSLHFAFLNLHGTPLAPDQITVVWRVLRELRVRPVLALEQGIQLVDELEQKGLEVDPPEVAELLEAAESLEDD